MNALQQSNSFSAHLALAAGVSVSINAPTMSDLANVVGKLQPAEAANDAPGKSTGKAAATPASSTTPAASPEVTFDTLKKAFLALSTKADGRAKCEAVLKPFSKAKLSELAPEQYAAALAGINKASA